jgi:alkane 1-monooxygenase
MPILTKSKSDGFPGFSLARLRLPPWWLGFGLSLVFPASVLGFLATGPHGPLAAVAWTLPMWLLVAADYFGPSERRTVPSGAPRWFFDGILYLLALLQVLNVFALGRMVSHLSWGTVPDVLASLVDLLSIRLMVSANFVCAGICPAHELIHRRSRWQRRLGRLLLASVCYDHFAVAHRRAHHARLGSPEDPSTARTGESFEEFCRRSMLQQWRIAWRADRRAVLAGALAEAGLLAACVWAFGVLAALVFLHQSHAAVRTLESVNYFQHYGLTEDSGHSRRTAWRNDSAVSLFLFIGLTRHADHHRRPGIPYPDLRPLADGPAMPHGYLGMAVWVQRRNDSYRAWTESAAMPAGATDADEFKSKFRSAGV